MNFGTRDRLDQLLGGSSLTISGSISINGLSLTIPDILIDTGANGYIFISVKMARRAIRLMNAKLESNFTPRLVGGFEGHASQLVDALVVLHLRMQRRTETRVPMIILDMPHSLIVGSK
jgi:hypothetical protein